MGANSQFNRAQTVNFSAVKRAADYSLGTAQQMHQSSREALHGPRSIKNTTQRTHKMPSSRQRCRSHAGRLIPQRNVRLFIHTSTARCLQPAPKWPANADPSFLLPDRGHVGNIRHHALRAGELYFLPTSSGQYRVTLLISEY